MDKSPDPISREKHTTFCLPSPEGSQISWSPSMGLVENPWEEGGSAEHGQKRGGEKGLHRQRRGGRELDVWAASGWRDCYQMFLHCQRDACSFGGNLGLGEGEPGRPLGWQAEGTSPKCDFPKGADGVPGGAGPRGSVVKPHLVLTPPGKTCSDHS